MYPDDSIWWGSFEVAHDTAARWQIGPSTLLVSRVEQEWRIAAEMADDPDESGLAVELPAEILGMLERPGLRRFGVSNQSEKLCLSPRLPDRAVVAAPQQPVELLPGQTLTVYVGSPVWVHVEAGEPAVELLEMPLYTPAETWFGPSPHVGELCYASRTHCQLRLDELPARPHRAITSVLVENRATTALVLDALKLPVPHLALYGAANGWLWTQDVTLTHEENRELSPLRVREGAPRNAEGAVLVAGPREPLSGKLMVVRAFNSLFLG